MNRNETREYSEELDYSLNNLIETLATHRLRLFIYRAIVDKATCIDDYYDEIETCIEAELS